MEPILVYDTTLRDGTQGENINFSANDKLKIAKKLDELGVHYIEGGWPGSNKRDESFFTMAKKEVFRNARIAAFGSTHRYGISAEDDPNLKAVLESGASVGTLVGKTWDLHVEKVLNIAPSDNLELIRSSVAHLKRHGMEVHYDAEHFFDGYKDNPGYAVETLKAAVEGGADALVLCDTNGGCLPYQIEEAVNQVKKALTGDPEIGEAAANTPIGIHTHNDSGLAVANTITAVKAGATIVQGTINGYGERCGNADLTSIIPIVELKMNRHCLGGENLKKLRKISLYVSETANMPPIHSRPFVGKSAFAHKGGIHVNAIMKEPRAYEHMDPALVGNQRRVLMSDMAGKSNVEYKARELGIDINGSGINSSDIVAEVKRLEQEGYQFDVADGTFKILMEKLTHQFEPLFELDSFRVTIEKDKDQPCYSHAMIKIGVGNVKEITAAEGQGPVSALDNALRKALNHVYGDQLDPVHLVDFKVRVLDSTEGTASKVRVLIESRDEEQLWSTMGASEDIIEASWQALAESFQFKLAKNKANGAKP